MGTDAKTIWRELEGQRIYSQTTVCLGCRGRDGILRRHHCKNELELYCDWCEEWTGHRLDYNDVASWVRQGGPASGQVELAMSRVSRLCHA
jgi:hypothetical protein